MDRAFQKTRRSMRKKMRIITGVLVTAGAVAFAQQGQQQQQTQDKQKPQQGSSSQAGGASQGQAASQGQGATANESGSSSAAGSSQENLGTPEKPIMVVAGETSAKGTVTDVSKLRHTIKVKTEDGSVATIKMGKEVKNFDQVKKGDQVDIKYNQETVIALRKTAGPPSTRIGHAVITPTKGAPPIAAEVATIETTAVVDDIDQNSRTVKLRAADGSTRTLKVGDEVQNLDEFKKGDQVAVRTTEGLAVEVQRNRK
jgi:hypothetical protein